MSEQVGDPLDVVLDATRHVAEGRGVVRADKDEEVREVRDAEPEERLRTVGPRVDETSAALASDVDPFERPRDRVEPCRQHDDVAVWCRRPSW